MNENSPKKQQRPLLDIVVSVVIPSLILSKLSGHDDLGPVKALILALMFPISQFVWEMVKEKSTNFIAILGFVSVVLTGGIGLFELEPHWIAIKEAFFPALIGIAIVVSLKTPYPLVRKIIYNDAIIDTNKVALALEQKQNQFAFDKLLVKTSGLLAASFFLSSILNYVLAKRIVITSPKIDPVAFNEQIGMMTAYSYPVIVIPSMAVLAIAMWILLRGLKNLTGLNLDEIFHTEPGVKN